MLPVFVFPVNKDYHIYLGHMIRAQNQCTYFFLRSSGWCKMQKKAVESIRRRHIRLD